MNFCKDTKAQRTERNAQGSTHEACDMRRAALGMRLKAQSAAHNASQVKSKK